MIYAYDLTAAYPSVLAKLPNLEYAEYIKTDGNIPDNIYWGILKGRVTIWGDVSPIVYTDGKCYKGTWDDYITTDDLQCIKKWRIGKFEAESGWFVRISKYYYIFDYIMRQLFSYRGGNELRDYLAKNMANSIWGRFIQMNGEKFGDYFMPPYASMVTSKVRCKVCDFIYENDLGNELISVLVDGCLATKLVKGVYKERRFGEWRVSEINEALVLSSQYQWHDDKKPNGFTITQMLEEIKKHPLSKSWEGISLRFLELDREFDKLPKNGQGLLSQVYESKPLEI